MSALPPFSPRNLVALSDGTGNSAAKLHKTNIWRTYEALDLTTGDQVAMYDDGVGTAAFKPLAVLGGAFGYGLKRNVLDLYLFLCRNYRCDPADPSRGDHIYAFGFSRGAYTARILVALVGRIGLVQADDDAERRRLALWAYRRYRAERFPHYLPVRIGRWIRDVALGSWERIVLRRRPFDPDATVRPDIRFVGVYDTVAAYGLPIDELTRGFEKWVWPMLPKDRSVSSKVTRACQALALDDERHTFFPLLWNEDAEPGNQSSTHVADERISQVWFAGMHSDVGGGYPDDGTAHTPLAWMATEAARCGLRFRPSLCAPGDTVPGEWRERAVHGTPLHDSRRGLGVYYRYSPRPVEKLCRDRHTEVFVPRPKVHESVFERMRAGGDGYAPVVLPETYAVVTREGRILADADTSDPTSVDTNPYEHGSQRLARRLGQEHALNAVWWRRVVYFVTVATTAVLGLIPLCPVRERLTWPDVDSPFLSSVVGLLAGVLPGGLSRWVTHYERQPVQLLIGVSVIAGLLWASRRLTVSTADRMRAVWRRTGLVATPIGPVSSPTDWVYRLRTNEWYQSAFHAFSYHVVPNVFGVTLLVLIFGVLPLRVVFELVSRAGRLPASACQAPPIRLPSDVPGAFAVFPSLTCQATGHVARKGEVLRVEVALPGACASGAGPDEGPRLVGAWADHDIPVPGPHGFSSLAPGLSGWRRVVLAAAVPVRRLPTAPWLAPVVEIGTATLSRLPLTGDTITAERQGVVTMYVNDAVLPLPGLDAFYRNNHGGPARVRISTAQAPARPTLLPYTCDEQRRLAEHVRQR